MKKLSINPIANKTILKGMFALLILFTIVNHIVGQDEKGKIHDYLMPEKGKTMIEFYSGMPYIGVGQIAYGFSRNFSVGIIYGVTPVSSAYGIRMKAVINNTSEKWRIIAKSPVLYYPERNQKDKDAWMLAWPTLNAEVKLKNESKIWFGIGAIGVACTDYLFGSPKKMMDKIPMEGNSAEEEMEMVGIWNTFQFGYSKSISRRASFVIEASPVMEGFKLKSKSGFLDAFPVIVTLGLSYTL